MRIKKMVIENFKSFQGVHEFDFDANMIFLVGENNTGKTTILNALSYLLNGSEKDTNYKTNKCVETDNLSVIAEIEDNFSTLEGDLKKYSDYIIDNKKITIKRSSKIETIKQNGKDVDLNQSKIQVYNPNTSQFENPSGKDATFKSLLDAVFVWSETQSSDVVDFGSAKILGKLISFYAKSFFDSELYKNFETERKKVFIDDSDSLVKKLDVLGKEISDIFSSQYGGAKIEFDFGSIDPTAYTKAGRLLIDENGDKESLQEKGSGMQRAVALSLIQLFSNIHLTSGGGRMIFCIDEPELNLHPLAQERLITALSNLSENFQIFITTHSPNILKNFKETNNKLFVFSKNTPRFNLINNLQIIGWGPTISEVNYFAYNLYSRELYIDLYAYLEYLVIDGGLSTNLETYLSINKGIGQISYIKLSKDGKTQKNESWTPISITRHKIHHGDNKLNGDLTDIELRDGIEGLISYIKELI